MGNNFFKKTDESEQLQTNVVKFMTVVFNLSDLP